MSLILTHLNKFGIVHASDSNLTSGDTPAGRAKKTFPIKYLHAGLTVAGAYSVAGKKMDEWMQDFIAAQLASGLKSLSVFASLLGATLEAEMLPDEKKNGSVVHVAGYVRESGVEHPEFYFVRNIDLDPVTGGYADHKDKFLVDEQFWTRDCPKGNLMSAFHSSGRTQIYINGYPPGRSSLSRGDASIERSVFTNMGNSAMAVPSSRVTRRNGFPRKALHERHLHIVRGKRLPSAIHWRQNPDLQDTLPGQSSHNMLIGALQRRPVVLACVVVLSGCSRDNDALDRFSRAYTTFSDVSGDTRAASIVVIFNDGKQGYWTELGAALDHDASNRARLQHARAAIKAESETIDSRFDAFNSALDSLDRAVAQLVEIGNSVRNRDNRENAIAVSQRAREVHSSFKSLFRLYGEGFSDRRKILEGIVANGGNLVPAIMRFKTEAVRIAAIAKEQETVEQQMESVMDQTKTPLVLSLADLG